MKVDLWILELIETVSKGRPDTTGGLAYNVKASALGDYVSDADP
jgi:hypothetical protein